MAANNKEEKKLNPFVEGVLGVASLALITVVGFFVFFAFDILLLDFDPIGKLVQLIFEFLLKIRKELKIWQKTGSFFEPVFFSLQKIHFKKITILFFNNDKVSFAFFAFFCVFGQKRNSQFFNYVFW